MGVLLHCLECVSLVWTALPPHPPAPFTHTAGRQVTETDLFSIAKMHQITQIFDSICRINVHGSIYVVVGFKAPHLPQGLGTHDYL